ncbi:MAG: hypothetical protein RTU30_09215 [Candidatus Thorarchaeota archaeon]
MNNKRKLSIMMKQHSARLIVTCAVLLLFMVSGVTGQESISPEEDFEDAYWGVEVGDLIQYTWSIFQVVYYRDTVHYAFYINITSVPALPDYHEFINNQRIYRPQFEQYWMNGSKCFQYGVLAVNDFSFWPMNFWDSLLYEDYRIETSEAIGYENLRDETPWRWHTRRLYSKSDGAIHHSLTEIWNISTDELLMRSELTRQTASMSHTQLIVTGAAVGGIGIIALVVLVMRRR